MRVVTLCPNPAVDVSSEAEQVRPHRKIRTGVGRMEPGGGGINVARVLAEFGVNAELLYMSGGVSGRMLDDELERREIEATRIAISGSTRIAFNVHERCSGAEYRFVPEGPSITEGEARQWRVALESLPLAAGDIVVASGSLPHGLPLDSQAALSALVQDRGARLFLDTSGPSFAAALAPGATPPFLIKPSIGELETLVGGGRLDERTAGREACRLVDDGRAEHVIVSMGAHGALLASGGNVLQLPSLRVATHSAVGAGDSFLGAMVWRIAQGDVVEAAFPYGIAAGAAAVMTDGTELCRRSDVESLYTVLCAREGERNWESRRRCATNGRGQA